MAEESAPLLSSPHNASGGIAYGGNDRNEYFG